MGADLVTFVCVGPDKLDVAKAKPILQAQVEEWLAWAASYKAADAKASLDPGTELPSPPDWIAAASETESFGGDDSETADACPFDDADDAVDEFLAELQDAWCDGDRQTNWRFVGKGDQRRRVWVSGCVSWGDEPDNVSYRLMKQAHWFGEGFLAALGLE